MKTDTSPMSLSPNIRPRYFIIQSDERTDLSIAIQRSESGGYRSKNKTETGDVDVQIKLKSSYS